MYTPRRELCVFFCCFLGVLELRIHLCRLNAVDMTTHNILVQFIICQKKRKKKQENINRKPYIKYKSGSHWWRWRWDVRCTATVLLLLLCISLLTCMSARAIFLNIFHYLKFVCVCVCPVCFVWSLFIGWIYLFSLLCHSIHQLFVGLFVHFRCCYYYILFHWICGTLLFLFLLLCALHLFGLFKILSCWYPWGRAHARTLQVKAWRRERVKEGEMNAVRNPTPTTSYTKHHLLCLWLLLVFLLCLQKIKIKKYQVVHVLAYVHNIYFFHPWFPFTVLDYVLCYRPRRGSHIHRWYHNGVENAKLHIIHERNKRCVCFICHAYRQIKLSTGKRNDDDNNNSSNCTIHKMHEKR